MALVNTTFSNLITFTRASYAATYVDSNGYVTFLLEYDVPRFSYDPITLAPLGFLVEEQRSNQIMYALDTGYWYPTNCTIDYYEGVDPAGSIYSFGMAPTGGAGTIPQAFYVIDKTATAITYTVSLWVKGGVSSFTLTLDDGTTTNRGRAIFNLITGTLTSAVNDGNFTGTSATISAYKNSWYRITLTTTTNTTLFARFRFFYTATALNTPIVYLAFPQLEEGAFATSYIDTIASGSPTTRAADVASINTLSPWYNATEGTVYAQVQLIGLSATQNQNTALLSDGTNTNRIGSYRASTGVTTAVVFGTTITGGSWVTTNTRKLALGSKSSDSVLVDNGAVAGTSSGTTAQTVTNFRLGSNAAADDGFLNGYLQRVIYYPKRLTNSELQALTS
jgi:hypothetical protein